MRFSNINLLVGIILLWTVFALDGPLLLDLISSIVAVWNILLAINDNKKGNKNESK